MSEQVHPIFAVRGALKDHKRLSTWSPASPWPDAEVAFHWTNFDYPRPHIHEYWEMLVLVSGTLRHELNGKTVMLKQHQACLLRPDDCHSLHAVGSEPVIILNLMAKKEYMTQLLSIFGALTTEKVQNNEDLSFTVSEAALNKCIADTQSLQLDTTLTMEEKVGRCKVLFVNLISELMLKNIANADTQPKWLSNFLLKLSQSDLSSIAIKTDLTAESTYSYSRLVYLFKKHMGCTISQYISHLRVERAKEYLKNTNMRIIDVAAAVGCDNVTHFNRLFKKSTGLTPSQFRKENARFSNDQEEKEEKEGRKEKEDKIFRF